MLAGETETGLNFIQSAGFFIGCVCVFVCVCVCICVYMSMHLCAVRKAPPFLVQF